MIRKDYPTTGVLRPFSTESIPFCSGTIRKDYPTTGVLRLWKNFSLIHTLVHIRKDYPTTGVLRLWKNFSLIHTLVHIRKDYPTTGVLRLLLMVSSPECAPLYQEGLPDYWGIETSYGTRKSLIELVQSGRITRLLGY